MKENRMYVFEVEIREEGGNLLRIPRKILEDQEITEILIYSKDKSKNKTIKL